MTQSMYATTELVHFIRVLADMSGVIHGFSSRFCKRFVMSKSDDLNGLRHQSTSSTDGVYNVTMLSSGC